MLCALIMAGGKGTRFWPFSTEEKPKQFLKLLGEETMLQMTVNRIKPLIPLERIFICTGEKYISLVKEQLPEIDDRNIILEPEARNTAPCLALSAFLINRYYAGSTMVVLPSDHLINNEERFLSIIKSGETFLKDYPEAIVTLGITPDRPETGYGYIKLSKNTVHIDDYNAIEVERFVEKPDREKAEQYIREGNYLWNGGMFIWKTDHILTLIERLLPKTYRALVLIKTSREEEINEIVFRNYGNTESTSIDFGIMEHCDNIYVIPSTIGWDDVGSWESVDRYREKDSEGNIYIGSVNSISGYNNLVITNNHNVIIDGLSDIYVIENQGQIVIGPRHSIDKIKQLRNL
ncbi:mannose-1-phosphate guanylyltransferase [Clostridium sp. C8-1-8]|uniref:mannose-1-phosphate guanylyltransferase n=1 Tax=Clostridium sp. C8-1-8 TaxID=2698831 RepID=UPI0013713D16|nr:mannose-1-phosphate guanylyltransferase [Clostridium sp. C8-1-8]